MKTALVTILAIISCHNSFCQFRYPQKYMVDQLKNRTVIVQLLEEKTDNAKSINESIKKIASENWSLSNPLEFKYFPEVKALLKDHNENYAIMKHEYVRHALQGVTHTTRDMSGNATGSHSNTVVDFTYHSVSLYLITENKKYQSPIFRVSFTHTSLQPVDYLFSIQQFNRYLESAEKGISRKDFFNIKENLEILKSKNLILEQDYLKIKETGISQVYKYPYEVLPLEKVNELILKKDSTIAYPKLIWSQEWGIFMFVVVEGSTGRILSQVSLGSFSFKYGTTRPPYKVSKVQLKYFASEDANKTNNRY